MRNLPAYLPAFLSVVICCDVFSHRASPRGCICVDLCHLWEALLCKKILCVPCVLWEDTVCFVGAAETAAPPELASVGGNFMNVGAWVWQDAIPSYKTSVLICAICGRLFSARRFCAFRAFCGRTPFALLVQQRLLHPLRLHLWEAIS